MVEMTACLQTFPVREELPEEKMNKWAILVLTNPHRNNMADEGLDAGQKGIRYDICWLCY